MSEKAENRPTVYYIPENFAGESKVLGGRIRLRYLIDSVMLGAAFFLLIALPLCAYPLREETLSVKLSASLCIMAPGVVAGILGYNGDPITAFLSMFFVWLKSGDTRLYNTRLAPMGTDPIRIQIEMNARLDKLVDLWQQREQNRFDRKANELFIEGKTFQFDADPRAAYEEETGEFDRGELAPKIPTNLSFNYSERDFDEAILQLFREEENAGEEENET